MTILVCDLGGTTVKFGLYDKGRLLTNLHFGHQPLGKK